MHPRITELTKKDYRKETPRVAVESVKNFDRLGVKTPVNNSENGMVKLLGKITDVFKFKNFGAVFEHVRTSNAFECTSN